MNVREKVALHMALLPLPPLPMLASASAPPPVDPRKNTAVSSNTAVFAASHPRPDDIFIPREPSSFAHAERAAMQNVMQDPMGFKSELCPFAPGRCPAGAMCEKAHGVEQVSLFLFSCGQLE